MNKTTLVLIMIAIPGCDANRGDVGAYGDSASVKCYSDAELIYSGRSSGKVLLSLRSQSFYFVDETSGNYMEISADCVVEYGASEADDLAAQKFANMTNEELLKLLFPVEAGPVAPTVGTMHQYYSAIGELQTVGLRPIVAYQEGATATHPETGHTVELRNGRWISTSATQEAIDRLREHNTVETQLNFLEEYGALPDGVEPLAGFGGQQHE